MGKIHPDKVDIPVPVKPNIQTGSQVSCTTIKDKKQVASAVPHGDNWTYCRTLPNSSEAETSEFYFGMTTCSSVLENSWAFSDEFFP